MKRFIVIISVVLTAVIGCVKDIDLDQIDEIEILTDHNVSLIHFDLDVLNFLDEFNNESRVLSDTTRLPILIGPYSEKYLIQVDFNYELSNSFERDILMQFELLDSLDTSILKFDPVFVPRGAIDLPITQSIFENEIPMALQMDKIVMRFAITAGSIPLDPIQTNRFNLKSALMLHYKVTVEDE